MRVYYIISYSTLPHAVFSVCSYCLCIYIIEYENVYNICNDINI